jgi:hypothetical protein
MNLTSVKTSPWKEEKGYDQKTGVGGRKRLRRES